MTCGRLSFFKAVLNIVFATLMGLQVALAPLSFARAQGAPSPDSLGVICTSEGRGTALPEPQEQHPAGRSGCCDIGCLMMAAGIEPPPHIFDIVAFDFFLVAIPPATAAVDPPRRPDRGLPQAPRAPPASIG